MKSNIPDYFYEYLSNMFYEDIPRNKHDVGHRLALAARSLAYGEDLVYSGPVFKSHKIEGNKIRIQLEANSLASDQWIILLFFQMSRYSFFS